MFCPECGKENPERSRFCFICGQSLKAVVELSNRRSEPDRPAPQLGPVATEKTLQRDSGACPSPTYDPPPLGKATTIDCPNCGLINPGTASRCDCGYDFALGRMWSADAGGQFRETGLTKKSIWPSVVGWVLIVIAILGAAQQRSGTNPLNTLATMVLMITAGIGLIRRWSLKRMGIALGCVLLVPVIAAVTLPKLNRSRMYAQETAAIRALQTVNTAQVQYNSTFGRFAQSLTELGPPASVTANASAANMISADLAAGEKQGYVFRLTGTPTGYAITAWPTAFGSTGSRTFYSDQTLVIHENYGQDPATANSEEVGSAAQVKR